MPRLFSNRSFVGEQYLSPVEEKATATSSSGWSIILRSREVSWAVIGAALGISRQAAWERFSRADHEGSGVSESRFEPLMREIDERQD